MEIKLNNKVIKFNYNKHISFSRDELLLLYWQNHPRYRFVKTCKDGNFLDVGCGSGGLQFWRSYGQPVRKNIRMYGIDINKGEYVDLYESFTQFDLNKPNLPYEINFFDNIYSAHVFEHLEKPSELARKLENVLKPGGKIYIETPNHFSTEAPTVQSFQEAGIYYSTTTTNFYDDKTHRQPYSAEEIIKFFDAEKFLIMEQGTVWNDYLLDIMLSYAYKNKDTEIWTYAVWLYYQWCDYVVFIKK